MIGSLLGGGSGMESQELLQGLLRYIGKVVGDEECYSKKCCRLDLRYLGKAVWGPGREERGAEGWTWGYWQELCWRSCVVLPTSCLHLALVQSAPHFPEHCIHLCSFCPKCWRLSSRMLLGGSRTNYQLTINTLSKELNVSIWCCRWEAASWSPYFSLHEGSLKGSGVAHPFCPSGLEDCIWFVWLWGWGCSEKLSCHSAKLWSL